jgi:Glycosyl hydrolase family 63 C-terminal domain
MKNTAEYNRLESYRTERSKWKKWGPYLSERSWGTVREDYSAEGNPWLAFSYEMAQARAYRWNEDGIAGLCDRNQRICFSLALWNGKDPFLKERMFGLGGPEGNHGEDVKEYYFYLDNTPTHSYMKMLYKYPQREFPYQRLKEENKKRGYGDKEFELLETGIFDENRYFDVFIEYAKGSEEDILIRYTVHNRGGEAAELTLLPTLWFRNTWSWGYKEGGPMGDEQGKPQLKKSLSGIELNHPIEGTYFLYAQGTPECIFTENETNHQKLYNTPNASPYTKDAFHRFIVHGEKEAIHPQGTGTKAAAIYRAKIHPGDSAVFQLRLSNQKIDQPFLNFDSLFAERKEEADAFYAAIHPASISESLKQVQRSAFAGLLWNKQLYYLDMEQWRTGDPFSPTKREMGRNRDWSHLTSFDIFSMPDKWEYPYFCSWDSSFHCIPFLLIDADFAKRQLELLTREWYLHPNGQLPAYEWNFSDANPPVLAWSTWRAYKIDGKIHGQPDRAFLKGIFNKLLMNFTWWVNQKDEDGNNFFQGGFLGLDNISIFDRSMPLPTGGHLDQSDGTAWMAFYCILMMRISLHLALEEPLYQDIATKFFEHFLRIAGAMTNCGGKGHSLWDPIDGFFYDALHLPSDEIVPLKVRSLVGLLPLLAVETLEPKAMETLQTFARRVDWFVSKRPHVFANLTCIYRPGMEGRRLLAILTKERLISVLKYMLDENEFLSDYGIRSLSKYHEKHPYTFQVNGQTHKVSYLPGESDSGLFGGNSNWRGPIWFPINFLIIESLQKFHHYYGDSLKVEFPTGSGHFMNLWDISMQLSKRLIHLCEKTQTPRAEDPHWKGLPLFHEYYHGDHGTGLGASHQTGWTALVAKLIQQIGTKT